MKRKILNLSACLNLLSVITLVVGLGSGMLIYRTTENNSKEVLSYSEDGGSVYPIMPGESKKYLRDMELYGGKANVIADEIRRWFFGLWEGKSLAYMVACMSIVISFGIFYVANHLSSHLESDDPRENNQGNATPR